MPLLYQAGASARACGRVAPLRPAGQGQPAPAPRKPLRPEFERELIADFLPQIEKVEPGLLGRDLTAWKTARALEQGARQTGTNLAEDAELAARRSVSAA